jgi:hypothetical protein
MDYDHFINQVHARAHLGSTEAAVTAIRATLETLAERIVPRSCGHRRPSAPTRRSSPCCSAPQGTDAARVA